MDLIVENTVNEDIHPFEPYINEKTKFLIVGTIPPHRFCKSPKDLSDGDIDWFYGSKDNSLWEIISSIFAVNISELNSEEQRKKFSDENHIGFIDLFHQIYRYKESSSDSDIIPISFKNIFEYIIKNKSIQSVLFTSTYVENLSTSLLSEKIQCCVNRDSRRDKNQFDYIKIGNREIQWISLKSPSYQNKTTIDDKKVEWGSIQNFVSASDSSRNCIIA